MKANPLLVKYFFLIPIVCVIVSSIIIGQQLVRRQMVKAAVKKEGYELSIAYKHYYQVRTIYRKKFPESAVVTEQPHVHND